MTESRRSDGLWMLVAALVSGLVVAGAFVLEPASDRFRWVCEVRGHLWVQPTHGEPYCADGTGNPPDRNPPNPRQR